MTGHSGAVSKPHGPQALTRAAPHLAREQKFGARRGQERKGSPRLTEGPDRPPPPRRTCNPCDQLPRGRFDGRPPARSLFLPASHDEDLSAIHLPICPDRRGVASLGHSSIARLIAVREHEPAAPRPRRPCLRYAARGRAVSRPQRRASRRTTNQAEIVDREPKTLFFIMPVERFCPVNSYISSCPWSRALDRRPSDRAEGSSRVTGPSCPQASTR